MEHLNYKSDQQLESDMLKDVLTKFTVGFLLNQSFDIVDYGLQYFTKLREQQKRVGLTNLSTINYNDDKTYSDRHGQNNSIVECSRKQRDSIFDLCELEYAGNDFGISELPNHPKTNEQILLLTMALGNCLLFKTLDESEVSQIICVMSPLFVVAEQTIFSKGQIDDTFYVIESGEVFSDGSIKHTYQSTDCFGELALLYNVPCEATVKALTSCTLWTLDRQTFRNALLAKSQQKYETYKSLLNSFPIFEALTHDEQMMLIDALVSKTFRSDQWIFKQGDQPNGIYFIEEGSVSIQIRNASDETENLMVLKAGQYFGELSLFTMNERLVSAFAVDDVKLVYLESDSFDRLIGNFVRIIKRGYHQQ